MPLIWDSYVVQDTIATAAGWQATELFHNDSDEPNIFASGTVMLVDGIVTTITDSDDMCEVILAVAHEDIVQADFQAMQRHELDHWYSFAVARGPMVFRLRSKKAVPPGYRLWCLQEKIIGTASTVINTSVRIGQVFTHHHG